jgi:nickel superoxide dismutase
LSDSSHHPGRPDAVVRRSAARFTTTAPSGNLATTSDPAEGRRRYETSSLSPGRSPGDIDSPVTTANPHGACGRERSDTHANRRGMRSSLAASIPLSDNERTRMFARLFAPTLQVSAHCDLPCGVYDPAQARIEAESIKAIIGKVKDNDDPDYRVRAAIIKEQRSELVKHHLWVLWTDYFKPPHFEKYPQLHTLFNEATKLAGGGGGTKAVFDESVADQLLAKIDQIAEIFWETKKA